MFLTLGFLSPGCSPFEPSLTASPFEVLKVAERQGANAISVCANSSFSDLVDISRLAAEACAKRGGEIRFYGQDWGLDCPLMTARRATFLCEFRRGK
jgi:hypothetical protein